MSEAKCEVCLRKRGAEWWNGVGDKEWCGGPIDYEALTECYTIGYTRANERAEGLDKENDQIRAQLCTEQARAEGLAKELAEADERARVAGSSAQHHEARARQLEHDLFGLHNGAAHVRCDPKDCGPAAATARVAELEKQLADTDETCANLMEGGAEATRRADAAEAEVAELEKQLADKGRECSDLDGLLQHDHRKLLEANSELARLRALPDGGKPLVYLACPYTHKDRAVRVSRFNAANEAASKLMLGGAYVFSPISHTHPIAEAGGLPLGWDFWEGFDRAYIGHSRKLIVLMLEGWMESTGVRAEIVIAQEAGIPVEYIDPAEGHLAPLPSAQQIPAPAKAPLVAAAQRYAEYMRQEKRSVAEGVVLIYELLDAAKTLAPDPAPQATPEAEK